MLNHDHKDIKDLKNKILQIKENSSGQIGRIRKCADQRVHGGKWLETDDFEINNSF